LLLKIICIRAKKYNSYYQSFVDRFFLSQGKKPRCLLSSLYHSEILASNLGLNNDEVFLLFLNYSILSEKELELFQNLHPKFKLPNSVKRKVEEKKSTPLARQNQILDDLCSFNSDSSKAIKMKIQAYIGVDLPLNALDTVLSNERGYACLNLMISNMINGKKNIDKEFSDIIEITKKESSSLVQFKPIFDVLFVLKLFYHLNQNQRRSAFSLSQLVALDKTYKTLAQIVCKRDGLLDHSYQKSLVNLTVLPLGTLTSFVKALEVKMCLLGLKENEKFSFLLQYLQDPHSKTNFFFLFLSNSCESKQSDSDRSLKERFERFRKKTISAINKEVLKYLENRSSKNETYLDKIVKNTSYFFGLGNKLEGNKKSLFIKLLKSKTVGLQFYIYFCKLKKLKEENLELIYSDSNPIESIQLDLYTHLFKLCNNLKDLTDDPTWMRLISEILQLALPTSNLQTIHTDTVSRIGGLDLSRSVSRRQSAQEVAGVNIASRLKEIQEAGKTVPSELISALINGYAPIKNVPIIVKPRWSRKGKTYSFCRQIKFLHLYTGKNIQIEIPIDFSLIEGIELNLSQLGKIGELLKKLPYEHQPKQLIKSYAIDIFPFNPKNDQKKTVKIRLDFENIILDFNRQILFKVSKTMMMMLTKEKNETRLWEKPIEKSLLKGLFDHATQYD